MKTYYLAGPMSGIKQFNFPQFIRVSALLRKQGYNLISPHEMDSPAVQAAAMLSPDGKHIDGGVAGETWGEILAKDVRLVADKIDGIIFLPDWTKSRGANLEATTGLLVVTREFTFHRWQDDTETVDPVSKVTVAAELAAAMMLRVTK